MVRRYNEPVEVKEGMPCAPACVELDALAARTTGRPEAFIWRGRLYVVREVLAHWRERRAWWRDAVDPAPGHPHGIAAAARERQVWRVEASPGRLARRGVFDLARDDPTGPQPRDVGGHDTARAGVGQDPAADGVDGAAPRGQPPGWHLLRVAD